MWTILRELYKKKLHLTDGIVLCSVMLFSVRGSAQGWF